MGLIVVSAVRQRVIPQQLPRADLRSEITRSLQENSDTRQTRLTAVLRGGCGREAVRIAMAHARQQRSVPGRRTELECPGGTSLLCEHARKVSQIRVRE